MSASNNLSPPFQAICKKVGEMPSDPQVKHLVDKVGLSIVSVAYEDSARTKNTVWGPCISDMTLQVGPYRMPLIRYANFEDLSWDARIEDIPLVVGNEIGGNLYTVNLKEYLKNFRTFLTKPSTWAGSRTSLLTERDTHVIMTSQACFLPVIHGTETEFNVSVYNYQSSRDRPAVLCIVATAQGTSAQILDSGNTKHGQNLFFNQNGQKCSFVAQRLSDFRVVFGQQETGGMSQKEKQDNMIVVIQVPLSFRPQQEQKSLLSRTNVEDAIIRVGDAQGQFAEMGGYDVDRDSNFPIRVTLQYYKTTDNGIVDERVISTIVKQLQQSRKKAEPNSIGSLVVGGNTNRPTEHPQPPSFTVPEWWETFWLTYNRTIHYSEEEAKRKLFEGDRFKFSTLSEARDRALSILQDRGEKKEPQWNF